MDSSFNEPIYSASASPAQGSERQKSAVLAEPACPEGASPDRGSGRQCSTETDEKERLSWLTDPSVFAVNRLDAHSDHICYAPEDEPGIGESSFRQSLDGRWKFYYSPSPGARPGNFWQEGYDDSHFGSISVPGHIELQGFGQVQYINTLYPWDGHAELRPPQIDWEHTSVGSYVRYFDLSPGLKGKKVRISFQGAEQAIFVFLNGHFVGYAEDSFTPSEFDLSPYIREKGNRLCVELWQRSSAAWIEDQDFFRFSGLFRSVYLYAVPEVHIEDLWIMASLQKDFKEGRLKFRIRLSDPDKAFGFQCHISHAKQFLYDGPMRFFPKEGQEGYLFSEELSFVHVFPWSHERPELYQVFLTVFDGNGEVSERIPYEIGFRRFELKDGIMFLNGSRLLIHGVNRHEWNPFTGRAIELRDMESAMETILKNNINAVRTCHYPNRSEWYRLCDQNGIYVMDEVNMESHGSWQKLGVVDPSWNVPGNLPEWKECVLDRAKSMFERDKNHPSILFWSCGNESYAGEDILAMGNYFRSQDPGRLVHYEGCFHNRAYSDISDVESRMYETPEEIRKYLENDPPKPFVLCEYMHDMGNSLGGMESYIRLMEEFPKFQGGFIWDYMDQALWMRTASGKEALCYGGDFLDRQSDYAFSGNGIVFADGTEKPAMQEVRYWYSEKEERAKRDRANAEALKRALPKMRQPDRMLDDEEMPGADRKPDNKEMPEADSKPGSDKNSGFDRNPATDARRAFSIIHGDGAIGTRGNGFEILFSYPEGGPSSLRVQGREWLWRAPRPAFWRAPTENDIGNAFSERSGIWAAVDQYQACSSAVIEKESEGEFSIRYTYTSSSMPGLRTDLRYTVHGDVLDVEAVYYGAEGRPQLPLFGIRFATPQPLDRTEWIGLSGETYPDRKKGGTFGRYFEKPHIPPYLRPQECGAHADSCMAALHAGGRRLEIECLGSPFLFSAIPYTPWQLAQAAHAFELPEPCRTVVTICGAMRGVGGIDSWKTDVEPAYHVDSSKDIRFSFRIKLF